MRDWLGSKSLVALGVAAVIVVTATIVAAFGALWLAVGVLGILQLALLGMLLAEGPAADSSKRMDALSTRLMASLETERLDARDRHRELLDAIGRRVDTAN